MNDPRPVRVRLASPDGAAWSLVPFLVPGDALPRWAVDVELLSPDRLVRYLTRVPGRDFFERLGPFLLACASGATPESDIAALSDERSGLLLDAVGSDSLTVTIDVGIVEELDADVLEYDRLRFDVPRALFVSAAHAADELARRTPTIR